MSIVLRPGLPADRSYAIDTWRDSYRAAVMPWQTIAALKETTYEERLTSRIVACAFVVACDVEDSDRIYGWACGEPGVVHYVYVRDTRRRTGLGRRLVEAVAGEKPRWCTTLTPAVQMVAARHGIVWTAKARRAA